MHRELVLGVWWAVIDTAVMVSIGLVFELESISEIFRHSGSLGV